MRFQDTHYTELVTREEDTELALDQHDRKTPLSSPRRAASGVSWLNVTLIAIAAWILGMVTGWEWNKLSPTATFTAGLLNPPGELHEVWEHNLTFSDKPTPETEAAWNAIVPIGRGFVTHPEVAPFMANIAVFHQLHCLHAIRVAYYVDEHTLAMQAGTAGPDQYMERMAYTVNRKHMRHCFDYLRRALMCGADSNLESVSPDSHVTTGWGDERLCRNYAGVLAWSEQWRNSDDVGIAEPPPSEVPAA